MMETGPRARDLAAILIGAVLVLFPGLWAVDLFNPDEPREAEIAREMSLSGDFLVPTFNECPFLEKPPLFYWGVQAFSRLPLLAPELAVRLPSFFAALGLLVLTYLLGCELRSRRTGLAAAFILLTTFQFWWLGRRALLDMTLAFFVGATLFCFVKGMRRSSWFLLGGVAAAGAVMTKGFIGLIIPVLTIAAYTLWRRRRLAPAPLVASALIPLAAIGVWVALLATRPDGVCFVREFLVENHVKRFLGGGYGGHAQPFWYYIESLLTDFLPWSLFLPAALVALWPGWRSRGAGLKIPASDALLWAWLVPSFVVLSLSSSKRSIYLLPLAPAMALLIASWWEGRQGALRGPRHRLLFTFPAVILAALGAVVAGILPFAIAALTTGRTPRTAGDWIATLGASPVGVPAGIGLLLAVVLVILLSRKDPQRGAASAVGVAGIVLVLVGGAILPLADPRLSARSLGESMTRARERGSILAAHRITEGSLGQFLFYSGGTLEWIGRRSSAPASDCCDCREATTAEEFLSGPGPRACLLLTADYEKLPSELRRGRVLARGKVGDSSYVLLASPGS